MLLHSLVSTTPNEPCDDQESPCMHREWADSQTRSKEDVERQVRSSTRNCSKPRTVVHPAFDEDCRSSAPTFHGWVRQIGGEGGEAKGRFVRARHVYVGLDNTSKSHGTLSPRVLASSCRDMLHTHLTRVAVCGFACVSGLEKAVALPSSARPKGIIAASGIRRAPIRRWRLASPRSTRRPICRDVLLVC